jgi:hypothetical protein
MAVRNYSRGYPRCLCVDHPDCGCGLVALAQMTARVHTSERIDGGIMAPTSGAIGGWGLRLGPGFWGRTGFNSILALTSRK